MRRKGLIVPSPRCIYLDNHATTRVDPRVVEAMLPWCAEHYGNPGSSGMFGDGRPGRRSRRPGCHRVAIGAEHEEIVFTSGATESNNLAIRGVADRLSSNAELSLCRPSTNRPAPLDRLQRRGCDVAG